MMKFLRALFVIALVGGCVYLGLRLTARPARAHPWFDWAATQRQPLVFAHQGGEALRPSNTLAAFDHAVELGAQVLDADVHVTKDGVPVLIHDQTVDRTTNGRGEIRALTVEQLHQLDAGHAFTIDDGASFPFRGKGLLIPTADELFAKYPDAHYGIEIKQVTPAAAARFCEAIRARDMQDRVLVSAFDQETMDAFRRACPGVATSATRTEATIFVVLSMLRLEHALSPAYESLQVPEYNSGIHVLTPRFIEAARNRNLAVQPWTINERADLQRMLNLDVDGINTDYPDRLIALLR
jgi:glycerophosphoryl diester phosphodiesterase